MSVSDLIHEIHASNSGLFRLYLIFTFKKKSCLPIHYIHNLIVTRAEKQALKVPYLLIFKNIFRFLPKLERQTWGQDQPRIINAFPELALTGPPCFQFTYQDSFLSPSQRKKNPCSLLQVKFGLLFITIVIIPPIRMLLNGRKPATGIKEDEKLKTDEERTH